MKHLSIVFFLLPLYLFARQDSLPASGHYFTAPDGIRIYYEVQGNGKPVLLVHGFMGSGTGWKRTALYDALVQSGYKVITIDQRGNGRSDKPHTDAAYGQVLPKCRQ